MTPEQLRARRDALLDMRFRGVRETMIDGKRVSYASDAELASAISDAEKRLAQAEGKGRPKALRTYAVKDL